MVIGAFGALLAIPSATRYMAQSQKALVVAIGLVYVAILFACAVGLFKMRSWAVYLLTVVFIVDKTLMVIMRVPVRG
ncbi:MAG: hypothetical protein QF473_39130, partial [Planctomycetota bacterium]|nr:hypothetical protein [Planctomycetota bacterium]